MAEKYMLKALEVSKLAIPDCFPNPPVGCVLVKKDSVVAEGFTQKIGGNHAEVQALNAYSGNKYEWSHSLCNIGTVFICW